MSFGDDSCLEIFGRESFYGTGLEQLRLPAGLVEIWARSFAMCSHLREFTFEDCNARSSLVSIGGEGFLGAGIVDICLPRSLVKLLDDVFSKCSCLKNVQFCDGCLMRIIDGDDIFKDTKIREIAIPGHVFKLNSFLPPSPETVDFVCDDLFFVQH